MEVTYSELCDLLELNNAQANDFAAWQEKYALREGVKVKDCSFKLEGWLGIWEIYNNPKERVELEERVEKRRNYQYATAND